MNSMTSATGWATTSQQAVMAASVVYGLALVAYLAEWALTRRLPRELSAITNSAKMVEGRDDMVGRRTVASGVSVRTDVRREPPRAVEFAGRTAVSLTVVAALLHLMALVTRGLAADRVPWGNMYEFALAGSFGAVVLYLVMLFRLSARWLGLPLVFLVLAALMVATLTLYVPAGPLVPALHSYWLVIHVVAAILATGAFTTGAIASTLYLVRERRDRTADTAPGAAPRATLLPDAATIDQVAYRIHAFAFPVWTFAALVAGPIWAKYAWGRYWGWDPKEVWAFITWVVYASYLHARATGGWRGRRAAVVALVGFATVLFNFVGINLFGSGLHSYAGL